MNDEQFEQELQFLSTLASPPLIEQLRARDAGQREAIEAWKAAHAREAIALAQAWEQRDAAKDQLGAALFLLKEAKEIARLFDDELTAQISRFIARNSQSAQQPAQGEGGAA